MVFTNDGKNRIRDLFKDDLNHGELGTDGTSPLATDTDLLAAVAGTSLSLSNQTADKQVTSDYTLPATAAQGTTFKEFGLFNSSNTLFARLVFSSLTHSSTDEWQFSTRLWMN